MQVCTSLLSDNHTSTQPLSFLQARCLSCRPTNSIKALKANHSPRWEHIQNKNTVRTCDIYAVRCLKVLDSELKAYSGIVKNLGKEAEKLKKTDPANAKEIAAEQVDSCSVVFILWMLLLWAHSALCFTAWFFELCKFNFRGLWKHIFTEC